MNLIINKRSKSFINILNLKSIKSRILILALVISASTVFAQSGSITNIIPAQRTDGSMIVDITYDLAGPEPDYTITAEASFDDGVTFTTLSNVTGLVGAGIVPGVGKTIEWDFGTEFPNQYSGTTQIRLTASSPPIVKMVQVNGGVFQLNG
ncbi:MAG: hypothetical protein K8R68_08120, partial [Bacteroidales bacterium]|nr:hypothetical protein [Bacteroidales bacterium]